MFPDTAKGFAALIDEDGNPVRNEKPSEEDYRTYVLQRVQSDQGHHYFGSA